MQLKMFPFRILGEMEIALPLWRKVTEKVIYVQLNCKNKHCFQTGFCTCQPQTNSPAFPQYCIN